jgi:hypothetical protein
VEHQFTCAGDPAGSRRRVLMDEAGIVLADLTDRETQWLEANYFDAGATETLSPSNPTRRALMRSLSTGSTPTTSRPRARITASPATVGEDRLTGERW